MTALLKTIFLLPFRILIFIWSAVFVINACKSKDKNPTSGYIKLDKGGVIYREAFLGLLSLKDHTIAEADYATFNVLNKHYAKDKNHAYRHDQPLKEADCSSFEVVDETHAKDKFRQYSTSQAD